MTDKIFLDGRVTLKAGDCLEVLKTIPDCSVNSCVTDPPYHLTSIVKRFGGTNAAPAKHGTDGAFARASRGFMSKTWDGGDIAFRAELWAEVWRVLKPGGHVVAFSGTRTYHRMACAIEDAGFEIRDQLGWAYGTGFPKSHNVGKAIDKHLGAEREKVRVDNPRNPKATGGGKDGAEGATRPWIEAAIERGYHEKAGDIPATPQPAAWNGWGTALKPSWEPICLARKPLVGTVAENVLEHGTGAINVDGCRVGTEEDLNGGGYNAKGTSKKDAGEATSYATKVMDKEFVQPTGRWPANIVHDGSDDVASVLSDGAARFFYSAKADKQDRIGSKHPTVKPVDLMQWLCRLVTPPSGVVLDPFAGSGSTGEAAWREGFRCVLIEREEEYQADIAERLRLADKGPIERKQRAIRQDNSAGPLFGDNDNTPTGGGQADIRQIRRPGTWLQEAA